MKSRHNVGILFHLCEERKEVAEPGAGCKSAGLIEILVKLRSKVKSGRISLEVQRFRGRCIMIVRICEQGLCRVLVGYELSVRYLLLDDV